MLALLTLKKLAAASSSFKTFKLFSTMAVRPIVLCGPSGVGKSTLLKKLMAEYGDYFGFSVSHTTRDPRPGEEDGVHYHFVTCEVIEEGIENGEFIEHAIFSGNHYGTSVKSVANVADANKMCVLDIDVQGVKQVKNCEALNPHYIFVRPPSIEDLEKRLRGRGTETEESLAMRLTVAQSEMDYGEEDGNFDLIVINDDVDRAYGQLTDYLSEDIEKLKCD